MICLHETAYGKLNLTLDVLGRRPDGYHDLQMVVTSVSLCDEVTVRLQTGAPWQVRCDCADIPSDEGNLCWKAAKLFFASAQREPDGFTAEIRKRIWPQAGMAGGSADAAAVLRALNRHYSCFSEARLREIGLQVGSDVPYCLFGGTALAEGRGERLTRLPTLPKNMAYVLVRPDFSASTPELFRRLDECGVVARPDNDRMCAAIEAGELPKIAASLCNAFQPAVAAQYPAAEKAKQALLRCGALGACLTGTGSVVFGVFDGNLAAQQASQSLCAQFSSVVTAVNV